MASLENSKENSIPVLSKTGFHTSEMADLVAAGERQDPTQHPHYRGEIMQSSGQPAKLFALELQQETPGEVL